jgi:REP element-mobilizing transposase RayT
VVPEVVLVPRTARTDAPGLVQHVMARGIERRRIFVDDRDRFEFVARLTKVLVECCITCYAWALMPNHVHLAVRTGEYPLATAMARLLTGYAGYFNRRHERAGHFFQNRYRSIPVTDEAHLLALVRYIHRNPLRAGMVGSLDELARYPWTGHAALVGTRAARFQDTELIFSCFGTEPPQARERLVRWMSTDDEDAHAGRVQHTDPLAALIERACREFGTPVDFVLRAARGGVVSDVRALVAHLACESLGYGPREVGRRLGVSHAAVRKAILRGSSMIQRRPALRAIAGKGSAGSRRESGIDES